MPVNWGASILKYSGTSVDSKVHKGWIGVDLDGTLAHWDKSRGPGHVGEPIKPMVDRVKKMMADGKDVRIFTARPPHPAIRKWCRDNLGKVLEITNKKDRYMQCLYDDRVVSVKRNEGVPFSEDSIKQTEE